MIKKVKGGYVITHCHGGKKGRIDATKHPVSRDKARSILGAIRARRAREGKG